MPDAKSYFGTDLRSSHVHIWHIELAMATSRHASIGDLCSAIAVDEIPAELILETDLSHKVCTSQVERDIYINKYRILLILPKLVICPLNLGDLNSCSYGIRIYSCVNTFLKELTQFGYCSPQRSSLKNHFAADHHLLQVGEVQGNKLNMAAGATMHVIVMNYQ